jgi:hypothetical protein
MGKRLQPFTAIAFIMVILLVLFLPIMAENLQYAVGTHQNSVFLKYDVKEVFVGELKYIIKITNPTHSSATGVNLYVPLIRNETARHYAILYSIKSASGYLLLRDGSGNIYAYWKNLVIPRSQTFMVEFDYRVLSFSINYMVNSSLIGGYNKSSELYIKYTQSEEYIESNSIEIMEKALEITGGESDPYRKARLIYNFVISYLRYEVQEDEKGAVWALEHGLGDCSEYSYLFTALCRAAEIPARVQAGFAFHYANEILKDGHMWAEYYLENYGWIPVDATWQLFDAIDNKHFSSIRSTPEVIPYANYYINGTEAKLIDEQTVQLTALQPSMFNDGAFAQNIVAAVQRIRQTEFAIFFGKIFGTSLIFPSEIKEVERELLEGKICIQNAIDAWETSAQIASSSVLKALENVGKALNNAWMLVLKTFALYMGILAALMLILLFVLKRSRKGLYDKGGTSHIATATCKH